MLQGGAMRVEVGGGGCGRLAQVDRGRPSVVASTLPVVFLRFWPAVVTGDTGPPSGHTAWLTSSCCWYDMNAAFMSYGKPEPGGGARSGITRVCQRHRGTKQGDASTSPGRDDSFLDGLRGGGALTRRAGPGEFVLVARRRSLRGCQLPQVVKELVQDLAPQ